MNSRLTILRSLLLLSSITALFTTCQKIFQAPQRTGPLAPPDSAFVPDQLDSDYYQKSFLRYKNAVYDKSVKSVQLVNKETPTQLPVLHLNEADTLQLRFDVLAESHQTTSYHYTLQHCDANWQPSSLLPYEYIEGYSRGQLNSPEYSRQINTPYQHYRLPIPNEQMRLTKSGNYLLKVIKDTIPEQLVFTQRFRVVDQQVAIEGKLRSPQKPDLKQTAHALDFIVKLGDYKVDNPLQNVRSQIY
jgi:hypothetical protein